MTDIDDIRTRDKASGDLWFTGPASFTAQAARDRRTALDEIARLRGLLRKIRHAGIKCSKTKDDEWRSALSELMDLVWSEDMDAALAGTAVQPNVVRVPFGKPFPPPMEIPTVYSKSADNGTSQPSPAHARSPILWEKQSVNVLLDQLDEGELDDRACAYAAALIREALTADNGSTGQ